METESLGKQILVTVIFSMCLVLVSALPVVADQTALVPGPCLDKRAEIVKAIKDAESHNIGVKPYRDALASIEEDVKAGRTEAELTPRLKSLKESLYRQFLNYRTLKSGAVAPAVASTDFKKLATVRYLPESTLEGVMVSLVNDERRKVGLPSLRSSGRLASLAKSHSRDMVRYDYCGHNELDGKDANGRAQAAGIDTNKDQIFENVASVPCKGMSLVTIKTAHQALMDSPGHKANILNPKHQSIGVGVVYDKSYGIKATQVFCQGSI